MTEAEGILSCCSGDVLQLLALVEVLLKLDTKFVHGYEVGVMTIDKDLLVALNQTMWSRAQDKRVQDGLPEERRKLDHPFIRKKAIEVATQARHR